MPRKVLLFDLIYKGVEYKQITGNDFAYTLEDVGFECPRCHCDLNDQIWSFRSNLRQKVDENHFLNLDKDYMCRACRYQTDDFKEKCRNHILDQLYNDWWSDSGVFTRQVQNGTYHGFSIEAALHKEWTQYGTEDKSTCIYYADYNDPKMIDYYKIGISNSLHIRSNSFDGLERSNYKVIREFSNRYIAAYVEYKIKQSYCNSLKENVLKVNINKIIDYVNNFKITDDTIDEFINLGWTLDKSEIKI